MGPLRGFSLAAVVLLWLVLEQFADNAWLTEANYMDPVRGFLLAAIALLWLVVSLATNPWQMRASRRRAAFRRGWVVESLAFVGSLWVIAAPIHPEFGLVFMVIACLACPSVLGRKSRKSRQTPPCEA